MLSAIDGAVCSVAPAKSLVSEYGELEKFWSSGHDGYIVGGLRLVAADWPTLVMAPALMPKGRALGLALLLPFPAPIISSMLEDIRGHAVPRIMLTAAAGRAR
jgi:hypothetical protein